MNLVLIVVGKETKEEVASDSRLCYTLGSRWLMQDLFKISLPSAPTFKVGVFRIKSELYRRRVLPKRMPGRLKYGSTKHNTSFNIISTFHDLSFV